MRVVLRGLEKGTRWVTPFPVDHPEFRTEVRDISKEEQAALFRKWNRRPADTNFRDFESLLGYAKDSFAKQYVSGQGEEEFFKPKEPVDSYQDGYTDSEVVRERRASDPDPTCSNCGHLLECKNCGAREAVEITERLWLYILRLADEQRTIEIKN